MAGLGVVAAALLTAAATAVLLLRTDDARLRSALPSPPDAGARAHGTGEPRRAGTAPGSSAGCRAAADGQRRAAADGHRRARGTRPAAADGQRGPWSPSTLACLLAAVGVTVLLPLPAGPVAGLGVALAGPRLLDRLEPSEVRARREQLVLDLPLALDLLSACLAGGAPLPAGAAAVGQAVGGPVGERLSAVGAALQVGAPPGEAWASLAGPDVAVRDDDPLGPAARALARAADGGTPVAAAVARLAADARAEGRSRAEQAARRVGVLAVAPLGLCFLPAFVLLGIVPLVLSLAGPLLAGA